MILYVCDKCHRRYKGIGSFYNLSVEYAGESRVNLPNDGKYMLCGKCCNELTHMLREWDGRILDNDENGGK